MTKCTVAHKNIIDNHKQREAEEEGKEIAAGSNARTVRKLTEETPDVRSIRDITEAVMEERGVVEIHRTQGNKSQDINQWRDMSRQECQGNILKGYDNKRQQMSHLKIMKVIKKNQTMKKIYWKLLRILEKSEHDSSDGSQKVR